MYIKKTDNLGYDFVDHVYEDMLKRAGKKRKDTFIAGGLLKLLRSQCYYCGEKGEVIFNGPDGRIKCCPTHAEEYYSQAYKLRLKNEKSKL